MAPEPPARSLDVADILRTLRRRWVLLAMCVLLTPVVALVVSLNQTNKYSATATLLFEDSDLAEGLLGTQPTRDTDPQRTASTNTALAGLEVVHDRTTAALAGRIPSSDIDVEVKQTATNNLAMVTATSTTPRNASLIATTFAEQFIDFRRQAARETIDRAISLLNDRIDRLRRDRGSSSEISDLRSRQQDLENLSAVQTGNVQLVERAAPPDAPSSPRVERNVTLGVLLGAVIGLALCFLVDRLDRRLRDVHEVEHLAGAPVLSAIPESKAIARQAGGLSQLPQGDAEVFRLLRAQLRYFQASRAASTILLTSSTSGEGKSTVAWNLAAAAAETGGRTLLIEADLRRPGLKHKSGTTLSLDGLSTVLSEQTSLEDAIRHYESPGGTGVDMLYSGPTPPNPADLLESDNMRELLDQARSRYDITIIDTAPALVVADAIPLFGQVDGVLVVARLGHTTRDGLSRLHVHLQRLEAPVLGVVVNSVARGEAYGTYASYTADAPPHSEIVESESSPSGDEPAGSSASLHQR